MVEKTEAKPRQKRKEPLSGHLAVTMPIRDAVNDLASGLKMSQSETIGLLLEAFTGGGDPFAIGKTYREEKEKRR